MTQHPFTLDVVSPQLPCGAAWLANALLELQIPLEHLWGFDTAGEWQTMVGGVSRYSATHMPWCQTLASLQLGREFRFIKGIKPRFSHAFPWQLEPELTSRIIWMVRDPRDALYSEWRRQRRNEGLPSHVSFPEFLHQPFLGGPVSVVDMLWLHLSAWQNVANKSPDRVLLLRFEDWKRQPISYLQKVANWIGLDPEHTALHRACAASDVSHLQAIEQSLTLKNPNTRQFNRCGTVFEWVRAWPHEWHDAMGPEWSALLARLGYAPLRSTGVVQETCDLTAMLNWRGVSDPAMLTKWKHVFSPINAARS